ncbi:MAG: FkbM family methyltransferase [Candidatus Andersenbacteria bacterium]|nr:FkbM family methyltransferase [Candidatus Andersenbacteria bacterium]
MGRNTETNNPDYAMSIAHFFLRIFRSLKLDMQWITTQNIPEKWKFLKTKYMLIAMPSLFWNNKINAFGIPGWGRTTYIAKPDRIENIQSIFIDHAHLQKIAPKNGIVVDVGANIGEFALFAHTVLSPKKIYSFEPVPRSFELLEENNNDFHFNGAICNEKKMLIHINEQSGMSSKFKLPSTIGTTVAMCKSLDDIPELQALPTIDLLKIDVEGMEHDVIASSPTTVKKSKYLAVETALKRDASQDGLATLSLLKQLQPELRLIYIGHIITYADTGEQAAVDMVFKNISIKKI